LVEGAGADAGADGDRPHGQARVAGVGQQFLRRPQDVAAATLRIAPGGWPGGQVCLHDHHTTAKRTMFRRILNVVQNGHSISVVQTHLDWLEAESIDIMREAAAESERPVLLYSIGK